MPPHPPPPLAPFRSSSSSLCIQLSPCCICFTRPGIPKEKELSKHYWDSFRFRNVDRFLLPFFSKACFLLSLNKKKTKSESGVNWRLQSTSLPAPRTALQRRGETGDMSFRNGQGREPGPTSAGLHTGLQWTWKAPWNTRCPTIKNMGWIKQRLRKCGITNFALREHRHTQTHVHASDGQVNRTRQRNVQKGRDFSNKPDKSHCPASLSC